MIAKNNFIENLNEKVELALHDGPPLHVSGQNWALIIVLGPEGCTQRNVKYVETILGTFETEAECDEHAEKLWKLGYQWFDMHKVPMYKCLPFPPCTKPENVKYVEKEMNQIMQGYRQGEVYAQKAIQDRIAADRATQPPLFSDQEEKKNEEEKTADQAVHVLQTM